MFRITRVVVAIGGVDMFMIIVSFIDINGYSHFRALSCYMISVLVPSGLYL